MGGACSTFGGDKRCMQGFGRNTRGKGTTWKTKRRWEDNIKMDPEEVGCGGMD